VLEVANVYAECTDQPRMLTNHLAECNRRREQTTAGAQKTKRRGSHLWVRAREVARIHFASHVEDSTLNALDTARASHQVRKRRQGPHPTAETSFCPCQSGKNLGTTSRLASCGDNQFIHWT
jgi:hypothetical protein